MNQVSCCCGAVRGAISVPADRPDAILEATARLLHELVARNDLVPARITSAFFTATPDLTSEFPAHAARRLGWTRVPLLGAVEMAVAGAPPRIVRVLLTVSGLDPGRPLVPVYLDDAQRLRPDLAEARREPPPEPCTAAPPAALGEAATPADDAAAAGPPIRLAIIGLGQIGGSIGLALAYSARWRRIGFDVEPEALATARRRKVIDEAAPSLAAAAATADVAVIAVPMDSLPRVIDEAAGHLPAGAVLLDTGSVRGPVTPALERAAARGLAAVGGHPLAGNEIAGLAGAREDLFDGAPFALLPVGAAGIPPLALELVDALGASPLPVTPEEHDPALARTSHLLYLASCAVRDLGAAGAAQGLAGPGFRGMTRLSSSGPRMALSSCRANAVHVRAAWHDLRARLDQMVESLNGT